MPKKRNALDNRFTLHIPPEMRDKLEKIASANERSIGAQIRQIIANSLARMKVDDKQRDSY